MIFIPSIFGAALLLWWAVAGSTNRELVPNDSLAIHREPKGIVAPFAGSSTIAAAETKRTSIEATAALSGCYDDKWSTDATDMSWPLHDIPGILSNKGFCVFEVKERVGPLASVGNGMGLQLDLGTEKFRPEKVTNVQVEVIEFHHSFSIDCRVGDAGPNIFVLDNVNDAKKLFEGLAGATPITTKETGLGFTADGKVMLKGSKARLVVELTGTTEAARKCNAEIASSLNVRLKYFVPTGDASITTTPEGSFTANDEDAELVTEDRKHEKRIRGGGLGFLTSCVGAALFLAIGGSA